MSDLRELLAGVAEQAKVYDVADRAVRAARRRARVRRYTPIAAVAVVALVVAGVWIPLASSRDGGSMVAGPVAWLPEVLTPPEKAPPVLDPDRPVGRGSLLYRVRERPGTILLAENGRQYTIPDAAPPDPQVALALSPGGRWLLLNVDNRLLMQDLRTGGRRQLSTTDANRISWRWSPNGRWLALAPGLGTGGGPVSLIDLTTWRTSVTHTLPPSTYVSAVRDSGEVLAEHHADDGTVESRELLHPSGAARALPLDAGAVLRPGEQADVSLGQVLADGSTVLTRTWIEQSSGDASSVSPDDVLVFDAATGKLLRRIELPDPVFAAPTSDVRVLAAALPEGILLWHYRPDGPEELELMDRETGQLTVVTRPIDNRIEDLRPRGFPR